jgi:hypothetical protein
MTSGLRTANRARQVVQRIEKSAFSTVPPVTKSAHNLPVGHALPLSSRNCTARPPACHLTFTGAIAGG